MRARSGFASAVPVAETVMVRSMVFSSARTIVVAWVMRSAAAKPILRAETINRGREALNIGGLLTLFVARYKRFADK
jgi:hypothetical protein